jgi:hypothetical protein
MINFEAVIRHFWQQAVRDVKWDHDHYDRGALDALSNENAPNRRDTIRDWLQAYRVFRVRGIAAIQKSEIADAILKWADSGKREGNPESAEELSAAHKQLMESVLDAYLRSSQSRPREFTSLTSKALWLCHPDEVPMFDGYAQRALWILAKLEAGVAGPPNGSEYYQFVSVWKQFYEKYRATVSDLDTEGYPYRVRVFDRILWLLGKGQYTVPD